MNISSFSNKVTGFAATIVALTVLLFPAFAFAQTGPTLSEGQLGITPFLIEDHVEAGQSHRHTIEIFNTSDQSLPITVSLNDFLPAGNGGEVSFLPTDQTSEPSVSLVSWMRIEQQPEFLLPPNGSTKVVFSITPPADASPGTHYGGVLFSVTGSPDAIDGSRVTRKIGAIVLASYGTAKQQGSLSQFAVSQKIYQDPVIRFDSQFSNTGNVHLQPKGKIEIRNMFGQLVGLGYVNPGADNVLPKSARSFVSEYRQSWMLGRYTAKASVFYGNPKLESRDQAVFWVIPVKLIVLSILLAIFILIVIYIGIKRYNRWIINRNK